MAHAHVGCGLSRRSTSDAFVDRVRLAGIAHAAFQQRHMFVAVVFVVEARTWLVGIHHADLDDRVLLQAGCSGMKS